MARHSNEIIFLSSRFLISQKIIWRLFKDYSNPIWRLLVYRQILKIVKYIVIVAWKALGQRIRHTFCPLHRFAPFSPVTQQSIILNNGFN